MFAVMPTNIIHRTQTCKRYFCYNFVTQCRGRKHWLIKPQCWKSGQLIDIDLSLEVVTLFELYGFDMKKLKNGVA